MIAGVILDIKNNQCNKTFDYLVPTEYEAIAKRGIRVKVEFGNRNLLGIITEIKDDSQFSIKLKPIKEFLDYDSIISDELFDLVFALRDYNFSFLIDNFMLMIPNALKGKYEKKIKALDTNINPDILSKLDSNGEGLLKNFNLDEILKLKDEKKILIYDEILNKANIKTTKYVKLVNPFVSTTKKRKEIISYLEESQEDVSLDFLINDLNYSRSIIKGLEEQGAINVYDKELYREISFTSITDNKLKLNAEQQACYDEITSNLDTYNDYLIHGVCGSGKTELYMNIIESVRKKGKQAIMLVPEISLTPQMSSRFKARFGSDVAIIHSKLNDGEKYDEWRKIKRKESNIVVGARSALFVPMDNIGVIIMDEEQEESYVQDTNPKYDSHFVARFRAKYNNCPFIMGSATPNLTTYYNSLNGNIKLLEINKRANGKPLPMSSIIDMKAELKAGNRSVLSSSLKEKIIKTYNDNLQSILLINRRGYSSFVMCRSCGEVIKCPNCDVSLTYHKNNEQLICHYCNYQTPIPRTCPSCQSKYIKFVGDGTQKLEEELSNILPEARVLRMDSDTTKNKGAHNEIVQKFLNHEADILIGTQVVAKGLDFPLVSLVGIVNADLGLKMPQFDSVERTYDLLEQASGRAGRASYNGDVIIQTYDPDNIAIKSSAIHNYKMFYLDEIKYREMLNNPPFSDYIEILISSKDIGYARRISNDVISIIRNKCVNSRVLGPTNSYPFKRGLLYNFEIILRLKDDSEVLNYINEHYQNDKNVYISITRRR